MLYAIIKYGARATVIRSFLDQLAASYSRANHHLSIGDSTPANRPVCTARDPLAQLASRRCSHQPGAVI